MMAPENTTQSPRRKEDEAERTSIRKPSFMAGTVDEFGIPLTTPLNYEPVPLGVAEETTGIFPAALKDLPYPLLPIAPQFSIGKIIVRPDDASILQKLMGNAFRAISKSAPKKRSKKARANAPEHLEDFSRAFYKGKVPEVLFLHGVVPEVLMAFIDDVAVYLEKLLSMGFLSIDTTRKLSLSHNETFYKCMPCIVLVGHGLMYQRFMKALLNRIESVGVSHVARKRLTRLVMGRVVRGVTQEVDQPSAETLTQAMDKIPSLGPEPQPVHLRIAGGLNQTQRQVQHSLGRIGLCVHIENQGVNPVERLEIQQMHQAVQGDLLSRAYQRWEATQKTRNRLAPIGECRQALQALFFEVGRRRQAFASYEVAAHLQLPCKRHELFELSPTSADFLSDELREFLPALLAYAEANDIQAGRDVLARLIETL